LPKDASGAAAVVFRDNALRMAKIACKQSRIYLKRYNNKTTSKSKKRAGVF